jgi:hypothetical protein
VIASWTNKIDKEGGARIMYWWGGKMQQDNGKFALAMLSFLHDTVVEHDYDEQMDVCMVVIRVKE